MNTVRGHTQSPGPVLVEARRLQLGTTFSLAPGATVRPSSRCWSSVRLLKVGVMLAFRRLAVTPAGPQLAAIDNSAITAAAPTATPTGTTQPGRRVTVAPVKSRRRCSRQAAVRQATIQITLTASPTISGP